MWSVAGEFKAKGRFLFSFNWFTKRKTGNGCCLFYILALCGCSERLAFERSGTGGNVWVYGTYLGGLSLDAAPSLQICY